MPALLELPGCGALTAAKIIGEPPASTDSNPGDAHARFKRNRTAAGVVVEQGQAPAGSRTGTAS